MPYPRHALASVELSQVTQIRVSDDHVPGWIGDPQQAFIGLPSMMAGALGLAPFKDNYESYGGEQPGASFWPFVEKAPSMQHAISVLSAGPVSPGDLVGYAVRSEVVRSVNAAGRLLHPSRPATAIDRQVAARAFGPALSGGPAGEVWATGSYVSGWTWGHVIAMVLTAPFSFLPGDLASTVVAHASMMSAPRARMAQAAASGAVSALSSNAGEATAALSAPGDLGVVAYALNTSTLDASSLVVQPFDDAHAIPLVTCNLVDFQLWHTAPVHSNGWAMLGDLTKYVPVSPARIASVEEDGYDLIVSLVGSAGEAVPLTFWEQSSGTTVTLNCVLDAAGTARAAMPERFCA